ncbi:MAG: hypothetical protein OXH05_12950 [Acidobacteria bacterium]|nr:hypothetical protein [Acidobacteriota bacterium]
MFLGAGLVLTGCGDDDTATTPAPAPPPPPPPAPEPEPEPEPPQAPATPTGFHVDTTQTSLTWHWNAVEGAIGYAVQISTDEMFDAEDTITPTVETSFTVADLPPQTTLYGRVAAAAGTLEAPILSAWTTHVTGTTDMPPPPPPPPMAPATPTGLMSEGGEGSITWSWDAVEGADGYAIQVSMDEMFDDMDETTYTAETSHTVSDLGYGEALYARVASTSGEGEDMLMSMWTTHMTGMSMEAPPPPMAPATPTGLMSETGEGSITWSWDEVEGALGYAIQVSTDEMFDDSDELGLTMETSHTVSPLPPGTTLYARVRSGTGTPEALAAALATGDISGLLLSAWTTHVTGMSAMPPPPPPPDPVSVSFTAPEGEFPMKPDEDDDEETAMAQVNQDMTVTSNTTAVVVPYNFNEDAAPAKLHEGDNTPFKFVNWNALQSLVVTEGATFKIMRVTVGANQMEEPTDDVTFWTCGPFKCIEGMDAPGIDIADSPKCTAWQSGVDVELRVGYVDNTVAIAADTDAARAAVANDGVDVGWVYESTEGMTVKHHFNGASNGKNYTQAGPDVGKTSMTSPLTMVTGADDAAKAANAAKYAPAIVYDLDDAGAVDGTADGSSACLSQGVYDDLRSSVHRPDNCFRIVAADADNNSKTPDPDWLGAYTIEVAPKGANVSWGSKVEWDEIDDPFEDHTCEGMTFVAMDEMETDVCELFADEVEAALDGGWAGSKGTGSVFQRLAAANDGTLEAVPAAGDGPTQMLGMIRIPAPTTASTTRFATLWFSNNDGGKNEPDTDLYADTDLNPDGSTPADTAGTQRAPLQFKIVDADMDPIADIGDFGKVDLAMRDEDDATPAVSTDAGSWVAGQDGTAENGNDSSVRKCSDDDGGDGCDAEFSTDIEVTFATGTALGCDPIKETVTLTCEWDSDGEMGRYRADDHHPASPDGDAAIDFFGGFASGGASGARVAGHIGAFAKCTVS